LHNLIPKENLIAYLKSGRVTASYQLQDITAGKAGSIVSVFTSRSGKCKTENILLALLALVKDISIRCPYYATIMIYEKDYFRIRKYLTAYDHNFRFNRICRRRSNFNKKISNISFVIQQIVSFIQTVQKIDVKIIPEKNRGFN